MGITAYCDSYAVFRQNCCDCGGGTSEKDTRIGYEKLTSGDCVSNSKTPVTTKEECGRAAAELSLSDTTADTATIAGQPQGCYWSDGKLLYVSATTTSGNVDRARICILHLSVCICSC